MSLRTLYEIKYYISENPLFSGVPEGLVSTIQSALSQTVIGIDWNLEVSKRLDQLYLPQGTYGEYADINVNMIKVGYIILRNRGFARFRLLL